MSITDMFKAKEFKQQIEDLQSKKNELSLELENLKTSLTPEIKEAIDLNLMLSNLKLEIKEQEEKKESIESEIAIAYKELTTKHSQIICANETILLEEFSLYEPIFDFVHVDDYKKALNETRDVQKQLVKHENACVSTIAWQVDGSEAKGRKQIKDFSKLLLRSFNNECDIAVAAVRFNNFDRCKNRILKSYEILNKTGVSQGISITKEYAKQKLLEIHIALEYQQAKQKEKELLKELRAQEREAAKLEKELEAAREKSYKELSHYKNALEKINNQIESCNDVDDRNALLEKQQELEAQITTLDKEIAEIDYREANQKAGYVYIISNLGAFGENVYKIGMTRRLNPEDRISELSDASVPFNFDTHALIFSDNAPALEASLHRAFEDKKINMVNQRREFFNVTLEEIKKAIKENHDKTVEFVDYCEAEQYRESLKLLKHKNEKPV